MGTRQDFPQTETQDGAGSKQEIELEMENNNGILRIDSSEDLQVISYPQIEQEDQGISSSFFSSSKINLMEIDSLEDVFTCSAPKEPEQSSKYLEWEESLSDISNGQPQQQLTVTDDGIRGLLNNFLRLESTGIPTLCTTHKIQQTPEPHHHQTTTNDILEENGLETLEEPNYLFPDSDTDSENGRASEAEAIKQNHNNEETMEEELSAQFEFQVDPHQNDCDFEYGSEIERREKEEEEDPNQILVMTLSHPNIFQVASDEEIRVDVDLEEEEELEEIPDNTDLKSNPFYFHSRTNMIQQDFVPTNQNECGGEEEIQIRATLSPQLNIPTSNSNPNSDSENSGVEDFLTKINGQPKFKVPEDASRNKLLVLERTRMERIEEEENPDAEEIQPAEQNEPEVDQEDPRTEKERMGWEEEEEEVEVEEEEWTDCLNKTPQDSPSQSIQGLPPTSHQQQILNQVFITKSDSDSSSDSISTTCSRIFHPQNSKPHFEPKGECQSESNKLSRSVSSKCSDRSKENLLISASSPLQNQSQLHTFQLSSSLSFSDGQKTQSSGFLKTRVSQERVLKENSSKNKCRKSGTSRQNVHKSNHQNLEMKESNEKLSRNSSATANKGKENLWNPAKSENSKNDEDMKVFSGSHQSQTKVVAPQLLHPDPAGKETEFEEWGNNVLRSGSDSPAFPQMTIQMTSDICPGPKERLEEEGEFTKSIYGEQGEKCHEEESDLNGNSSSAAEDFPDEMCHKNTSQFVEDLFVKIRSGDLGDLGGEARILRFPLDASHLDSAMVLAVNSHLPQLHSQFLETPKEITFKISPQAHTDQTFLIGIIKIRCPMAIPVTYKLSSVSEGILELTRSEGVIFPRESLEIQVSCQLPTADHEDFEQLQIEGIVIYAVPFVLNRGFHPQNLQQKHVHEFWRQFNGPSTRFAQIKFIPLKMSQEVTQWMKQSDEISTCRRFFRGIWKLLSHLNLIKNQPPKSNYGKLRWKEVRKFRGSSLSQLILRRNVNVYRILGVRVKRLNDYRTALILSTILCAAGALFYFYAYEPEMMRRAREKVPLTFWQHCKIVLPKLWIPPQTQTQTLDKLK